MPYLYETHMHTCRASACGRSTGKEHAQYYREMGYAGIIITDHFFGGNTAVDRSLPWKERIDWYCSGYEEAREEGERIGLDVFFGIEQNYQGDEYLIYGLDKETLKAHPEMEHWTRRQQLEEVHRLGGCVIQAHPFRMRGYMDKIRVGDIFADGVEVANAGNMPIDDVRAWNYAREKKLLMTAGSDNHHSPAKELYGVLLQTRLTSIHDFVRIILEKQKIQLAVPPERFIRTEDMVIDEEHHAWMLDEQERTVPAEKEWL